jgi:hypothetical protein
MNPTKTAAVLRSRRRGAVLTDGDGTLDVAMVMVESSTEKGAAAGDGRVRVHL